MTMKPIRVLTSAAVLSAIGYLGCKVIDAVQERFADTAEVQDTAIASVENTVAIPVKDTAIPSLEHVVYDYLVSIGTDKNGFQTPLKTWGKTIDEIGQENLRDYVDFIVALTFDACSTFSFPSSVDCEPFMLSLFLQESQLYPYATSPYAAGIAQLGVETAVEHELAIPQGPKYTAWMQAREKRLDFYTPTMARSEKQIYLRLFKEEQTRLREYKRAVSQLPPSTFDERNNPECAIPAATAVINKLLKKYQGNLEQALYAYNFGVGNLQKAKDTVLKLPEQTQVYATKILKLYEELRVSAF